MDKQEIDLTFTRSASTDADLIGYTLTNCKSWVEGTGCKMVSSWLEGLKAEEGKEFKITLSIEEISP